MGEGDGEVSVCALMEGGEVDGVSVDVQLITLPGSTAESSEEETTLYITFSPLSLSLLHFVPLSLQVTMNHWRILH